MSGAVWIYSCNGELPIAVFPFSASSRHRRRMLVDVVPLRVLGVPRPRDEVRAAVPFRGLLQLDFVRPGWYRGQKKPPLLAGVLLPGQTEWALPPLDYARVERVRAGNIYIVGSEQVLHARRDLRNYRQAWWCRVVLPGQECAGQRPELSVEAWSG